MKAIVTKHFGPGNVRGSRIKASDEDGNSVVVPYDHSKSWSNGDTHAVAVEALCKKMNWKGTLVRGGIKNGWVFVFVDEHSERLVIK